ncbi:amino acid ABC transporter substrate-binding protein, PAAT family [Vogesella sp. LIG4]|nr:amino acid ABC transporter substrate-binding protein, PAAT family [Vogesella sp. LIG4]
MTGQCMRRLWAVLLCWGLLAPALAADISYMVIEQVEPFQIVTRDDPMHGGLVTEIVRQVFHGSPHRIHPIVAPGPRMASLRSSGQTPNWLSYGARPWLQPGWQMSQQPIFSWHHVLAVPRSSRFRYHRLRDLFEQQLILMHGYDYPGLDNYLRSKSAQGRIIDQRALSQDSAIRMLRAGRGVGYVDTEMRLLYNLREQGLSPDDFRFYDLSAVIPVIDIHLMYDRSMPEEVKTLIDSRLAQMRQSGQLAAMVRHYRLH